MYLYIEREIATRELTAEPPSGALRGGRVTYVAYTTCTACIAYNNNNNNDNNNNNNNNNDNNNNNIYIYIYIYIYTYIYIYIYTYIHTRVRRVRTPLRRKGLRSSSCRRHARALWPGRRSLKGVGNKVPQPRLPRI